MRWLADQVVPHSCVDKLGGTIGEQDRLYNPGFQLGQNKASEILAVKTCGGCGVGRNFQSLESGVRAEQAVLFILRPLPHRQSQNTAKRVAPPWRIPKAPFLIM